MQFKANGFPCLGNQCHETESVYCKQRGYEKPLLVRNMPLLGHEHSEPIFGACHLVASRCGSTRGLNTVATRLEECLEG
jgi:hypothetical protein